MNTTKSSDTSQSVDVIETHFGFRVSRDIDGERLSELTGPQLDRLFEGVVETNYETRSVSRKEIEELIRFGADFIEVMNAMIHRKSNGSIPLGFFTSANLLPEEYNSRGEALADNILM